nr:cytochrome P450 [Bradyrhizobium diazoefficiens]
MSIAAQMISGRAALIGGTNCIFFPLSAAPEIMLAVEGRNHCGSWWTLMGHHPGPADYRPPRPEPLAQRPGLFELLARLRRNPLECWSTEFFHQPVIHIKLPLMNAFVVNEPGVIRRVLMDNADNYRKDPIQRRILSSGLADGLLSVEGERWQTQRRMLAPLFAKRTVNSFAAAMLNAAEQLADEWTRLGNGAIIDAAAETTLITLNVLAVTIFSDGIGGDLNEFRSAMNAYFGLIGRIGALDLLGLPPAIPRFGGARLRRTMRYFESIIDEIIERRRRRMSASGSEQPGDLLSLLLRALDPSTGQSMSPAEVRSNILTFLSAGHETTANALAWSIFLLSQSPEWRAQVQEEAERELDAPVDGVAERLVVTRAVVEEALRLYPPIAALSRTARRADTFGDFDVKPGSLVVIAPYVLHRHRRLWDRPDVFDPARFLPEARSAIPRFAYLPFGVGPRICIGSSFALQEATIVLAVLMRRFDLKLMPNARVWPMQKITLRPAPGLPMLVASRGA